MIAIIITLFVSLVISLIWGYLIIKSGKLDDYDDVEFP